MPIAVTEQGRASAPADQAVLDLQVQVRRARRRDLGVLVDLVEGSSLAGPGPVTRGLAMAESVPLAGGSQEAVVTVTATWDLA